MQRWLPAMLGLLAVAGCGGPEIAPEPRDPVEPPPVVVDPAPAPTTAIPADPPSTTPRKRRQHTVRWNVEYVTDDDRAVVVRPQAGRIDCETFLATATETPQQVRIRVVKDTTSCVGAVTLALRPSDPITVDLEGPVGAREITGPKYRPR